MQRNYVISTTAISTTASGTTVGSGNTQDAAFTVLRTIKRTISAGELADTSQTWTVHTVVSATSGLFGSRFRLQRLNSGNAVQSSSPYTTAHEPLTTGTYDEPVTWASGTWAAGDQLALIWEGYRTSGSGNKTGTIDANGASYVDAPTAAIAQACTDNTLNNYADAITLGFGLQVSDTEPSLADASTQLADELLTLSDTKPTIDDAVNTSLGGGTSPLTQTCSDDLNLWIDEVGGDVESSWLDSESSLFGIAFSYSDDALNFVDAVATDLQSALSDLTQTVSDDLNLWSDDIGGDVESHWLDSESQVANELVPLSDDGLNFADAVSTDVQVGNALTLTISDDMNNLTDGTATVGIIGYDVIITEDLNLWADGSTRQANGLLSVSDDALNFADAVSTSLGGETSPLTQTVSDDLNNWADDIGGDVISHWEDSVSTDLASAGGLTLTVSDDANNLTDAFSKSAVGLLVLSDDSSSLNDDLSKLADGKLIVSDDSFALADAINTQLGGGESITLNLSDSLALSDGIALFQTDLLIVSDDAANLNDGYQQVANGLVSLNDSFTLSDGSTLRGDGLVSASDSFTLADSLTLFETQSLSVADNFTLTDAESHALLGGPNATLQVSDNLPDFSDSISNLATGSLAVSDTHTQDDSLVLGYGLQIPDSFTLDDAVSLFAPLEITCSDDLNNWQESVANGGTEIRLQPADDLNNWRDSFRHGIYGAGSPHVIVIVPGTSNAQGVKGHRQVISIPSSKQTRSL